MFERSRREEQRLRSVLHHLTSGRQEQGELWPGGRISRVAGGWNNVLYRVTGPWGDWAVKFTMRDRRDRAGREYHALRALRQAGLSVAPEPLLLDRRSYAQPVVVQTWLQGEASPDPPADDQEWEKLLQHLATVHSVTPESSPVKLRRATVDARSVREGRRVIRREAARLPREERPTSLPPLLRRFQAADFPTWSREAVALCRADNNILNVIRRPGVWASVDWENAGWGDPAFDVAQLMTHPAYIDVAPRRWAWVAETTCRMTDDQEMARRIAFYHRCLTVWWVARIARLLYAAPRGLDERLVDRPVGWKADMELKYAHYLRLAEELLN
ncbi:MAG: aminoglycoside phosphotransferase family protein [Anaerolineae bacterium]|nr:aminoglycoside phosphotransferase family protein [Anaerolineae bacterium]